ncbi:MAG: acyl-CoA dehydrogenase family protein [Salinirussus sp.]
MDFELSDEQQLIRREIRRLCEDFGDDYWREKDAKHEFGWEFFDAFADAGWCGVTIPTEYGGQGYGLIESALVQQEIARSGSGMAGGSITSHHVFSTAPLVEFGDEAHKQRYLPLVADGEVMVCTGVTEPNAGLNTPAIETRAERDGDEYVINGQKIWTSKAQEADVIMLLTRTSDYDPDNRLDGMTLFFTEFTKDMDGVTVEEIPKAGRGASESNEVWFEDVRVPAEDVVGETGEGFKYLLSFANSERVNIAANCIGVGQCALDRAADYAREREVFDGPIGAYQGIQHPLAESWTKLTAAESLMWETAWRVEQGERPGAAANALKLRASEDALEACRRAIKVHGGMGYAKEFDVERYWRESMISVLAPVSGEMIKNHVAQNALDLPRSY